MDPESGYSLHRWRINTIRDMLGGNSLQFRDRLISRGLSPSHPEFKAAMKEYHRMFDHYSKLDPDLLHRCANSVWEVRSQSSGSV